MEKDNVLEQPKRILEKISNLSRDQQLIALGAISMLEAAQISEKQLCNVEQQERVVINAK